MNNCGIYGLVHIESSKRYIGQSIHITERERQHLNSLRSNKHHCTHLQNSFNKYGEDAFTHEILEHCDPSKLNEREQFWIDLFVAQGVVLFNTAQVAGSPKGLRRSEETKQKLRYCKLGSTHSEETKQKMKDSQAAIADLKSLKAAEQWTPEARALASAQRKGRIVSEKTKQLLRTKLLQRWQDPAYRAKLSTSNKIAQTAIAQERSDAMIAKWDDVEFHSKMMAARV